MSAIADFRLIEKSKLDDLNKAAEIIIKKGFLKKTVADNYNLYLDSNTKRLKDFDESGYIFGNLLVYLQEKKEIDLLNSDYDGIANEISKKRGNSTIILTKNHRDKYSDLLIPEKYSLDDLIAYNVEFSEDNDPEFAKGELKGIRALRDSLNAIPDDNYIVILTVG
jgi:hypothetical protein